MNEKAFLNKSLGFFEFICIGINCIIGTGIFLLPAIVSKQVGPSGILAYLICGFLCFLIGLCFCEMSGRYEGTGGAYLYARKTLGPLAGFLVGWEIWLSSIIGWASVAKGFYEYYRPLTDFHFAGDDYLIITLIIVILSYCNFRGVKLGGRINNFFALTKMLPLILFVIAGMFYIKKENFIPFFRGGIFEWSQAIIIVLYAYSGFEEISLPAGEAVNARRDLPKAIMFVLAGVAIFYVIVQTVCVGVLSNLAELNSANPLVDVAGVFLGGFGVTLLALGGLLSIGGINSSIALTGPRALYALAEGGFLPSILRKIHLKFQTPYVSIIVNSSLTLILALTGSFETLLKLSVLAALWQYVPTCIAVIVSRKKDNEAGKSTFMIPGGLIVPVTALIICIFLIIQVGWANILWNFVGLLCGMPFYFMKRRSSGKNEYGEV